MEENKDVLRMTELTQDYMRRRRWKENVEPVVEELNKLASRRRPKHRFTLQNDPQKGLVVRAVDPEGLPRAVRFAAAEIIRVDLKGKVVEMSKEGGADA